MDCGHITGANGFLSIHFPFSIETQRPGAPPFNPVSPGGVEFFWPPPDGQPRKPAETARPIRGKNRMEMPHGNAPSPCRHSEMFQARARRVRLLAWPRFRSFFKSKFKAPKNGSIARFQGLGCYQTSSEIWRASGRARAAGAARETGLARRGGFLQSGPLLPIALPLAFSGRKPPCPLPSFKTRPC